MRIVLIGQAAFGEKVLAGLLDAGEDVAAVFCPPDPPGKTNSLRELAEQRGVLVYQPKRMRDPDVLYTFERLNPDLNVMAFVTDIVPDSILNCPHLGTIQYHPSLLPKHRGGSAINWAIIKGETVTGLSIFWPDHGIDTGPILLQKEVEIGPDDTTGSLYFNKLFPLGVEAMLEAVALVKAGRAPRIPQDEALATSEPLCKEHLTTIDWSLPVAQVYNLIRGANPQPGATTSLAGKRVKIYDSQRLFDQGPDEPGTVIKVELDGFVVAAREGAIYVKRVQPDGEAKQKAADFAAAVGLRPGDRFGV